MLPPLPVFQKAVAARQQSSNLLAQDSSSGDSLRLSSSSSPDLLSLVCTYTILECSLASPPLQSSPVLQGCPFIGTY